MDCVFGNHLGAHQPAISAINPHRSSTSRAISPHLVKPNISQRSSLGHAPHITNLENKTAGPELKRARRWGGVEPKDAYTLVRRFVDDFHRHRAGKLEPESHSPELFENTFSIRVTPKELARLRSELKMDSEDDKRSGDPTYPTLEVVPVHYFR